MRQVISSCLAGALGALLLAVPVRAGTPVTYTDGGRALFSFEAPDFWTVRTGGPRRIVPPGSDDERDVARVIGMAPSADGPAWVGFVSPRGVDGFKSADAYLRDIGPFLVNNAEVENRRTLKVGGLPAQSFAGLGTRNGRKVRFTVTVIGLPGSRVAVSVAVTEPGAGLGTYDEINAIYRSFRAAR